MNSEKSKGLLYYLKPGTGKTLIGLNLGQFRGGNTIFVTPASLCTNWVAENEKFSVINGLSVWKPKKPLPTGSIVCSYESFLKLDVLQLAKFKTFVFDESHKLKNPESQRSKFAYSMVSRIKPHTYFLTGTPFTRDIRDAYSQYIILDSTVQGKPLHAIEEFSSLNSFQQNFMQHVGTLEVTTKKNRKVKIPQYGGFVNQGRFFELTNPYTFQKEVDLNLPELNNQILEITGDSVPKEVDIKLKELAVSIGKDPSNFQTARRLSALAKAKIFSEMLIEYHEATGNPIVGFSCFPQVIEVAKEYLEKAKKFVIKSMGAHTSMDNRGDIASQFQKGSIDILLCSLQVAREGFTLTRADTVIFNDCSPVASDNFQASKRIHRIGQDKPCRSIFLSRSKIDKRIIELATTKAEFYKDLDGGFK